MIRRVSIGVRSIGAATAAAALLLLPSAAAAQTTVVIDDPNTQVADVRIQGGTAANTVFEGQKLATKIHPSNPTYTRRSVLKFDTHYTVPAGATVQSAKLTLTISKADASTRTLGVYRLSQTFTPSSTTWYMRKSGTKWGTAGGDLSEKWAQASVGATVGSKVTFDVTTLVQRVVKGTYGSSRYTRIAIVDLGSGSDTSYKEFHSTEASDSSVRPKLTVVYGGTTTTTSPTPAPTTGSSLKVLHWNIHRGYGTDGKYDLNRIASWIVKMNPHVVSLNEVHKYTSYAKEDQPARLLSMLKSKTGAAWYMYYRTTSGSTNGHGNVLFSRFPITSTSYCQLSSARVMANIAVNVNGRLVNLYSTHLDSSSTTSSYRIAEVKKLISCLSTDAQQKIVAGDFNARDYTTEINTMEVGNYDGWAEAAKDGTAVDYPGNTAYGATRNRRIDYVWYSKGATRVVLKGARVYDTRDANGYMPSDHKPLLVTFQVN
jgi:endonuclease/exonuclease/phosphatase family metal-dependent hydrolase